MVVCSWGCVQIEVNLGQQAQTKLCQDEQKLGLVWLSLGIINFVNNNLLPCSASTFSPVDCHPPMKVYFPALYV